MQSRCTHVPRWVRHHVHLGACCAHRACALGVRCHAATAFLPLRALCSMHGVCFVTIRMICYNIPWSALWLLSRIYKKTSLHGEKAVTDWKRRLTVKDREKPSDFFFFLQPEFGVVESNLHVRIVNRKREFLPLLLKIPRKIKKGNRVIFFLHSCNMDWSRDFPFLFVVIT